MMLMRKIRRKFKSLRLSWDSDEIAERKSIMGTYGLRRRKEILIAQEILRNFRRRARELISVKDERKMKALLDRMAKLGLLAKGQGLDDILALKVGNVLERRLETLVWRKGMATTPKQARQFIAHGHVRIGGKAVKSPSYMVPAEEEAAIKVDKGGG